MTFAWFVWLAIVQWTPAGGILRKANLWCVLGIPGVWWIDLQVDGVRRGYEQSLLVNKTSANAEQMVVSNTAWTLAYTRNYHRIFAHITTRHTLPCRHLRSSLHYWCLGQSSRPTSIARSRTGILLQYTASIIPQTRYCRSGSSSLGCSQAEPRKNRGRIPRSYHQQRTQHSQVHSISAFSLAYNEDLSRFLALHSRRHRDADSGLDRSCQVRLAPEQPLYTLHTGSHRRASKSQFRFAEYRLACYESKTIYQRTKWK